MILSGLTPHRLTFAGRIALIGLAAALLPLAPSIARSTQQDAKPSQSPNKPDSDPVNITVTVTDDKDDKDDDDKDEAKAKKKAEASAKADARKKESADSRGRGEKKGDAKDDDDDKAKSNVDAARKQAEEARMRAAEVQKKVEEMRVRALTPHRPGQPHVTIEQLKTADKALTAYKEARRAQMEHQDQFRVVQKQFEKAQADMLKAQGDLALASKRMAELGIRASGTGESGVLKTRVVTVSPDGRPVEIDSENVLIYQGTPVPGEAQGRVEIRTEAVPSPEGKPGQTRVYARILRNSEALTLPGVRVQERIAVPAVPPVAPVPLASPFRAVRSFTPAPGADVRSQDARIDAMERQLKQLLDEIKELRKGDSKGQSERR